ncbi:hypothetical protein DERF_006530 [Dermatophagoides farinae]|uniref:Uncharacterized protein n=1 Tax=Dermatophagoides farinae TaxID=6954 RepID=A0A922I7N7_DERFA|nr:hypothetical protein DERF_006530 [Dermatophagoides farinae]
MSWRHFHTAWPHLFSAHCDLLLFVVDRRLAPISHLPIECASYGAKEYDVQLGDCAAIWFFGKESQTLFIVLFCDEIGYIMNFACKNNKNKK